MTSWLLYSDNVRQNTQILPFVPKGSPLVVSATYFLLDEERENFSSFFILWCLLIFISELGKEMNITFPPVFKPNLIACSTNFQEIYVLFLILKDNGQAEESLFPFLSSPFKVL